MAGFFLRGSRHMLLILVSLGFSVGVMATDPLADSQLARAVTTWRMGDPEGAFGMFTEMVDSGTSDPRVFYYRGIICEQLGQDGSEDFRTAANLEIERGSVRMVNDALERTQGPVRVKIERIRRDTKNSWKADPAAAKHERTYADGISAMKAGNLELAAEKFGELSAGGSTDPRVYYMHGATLAKRGDIEAAKALFSKGLQNEIAGADPKASALLLPAKSESLGTVTSATPVVVLHHSQDVSRALESVQGEVRRILEREVSVAVNGQQVTRQTFQRDLLKKATDFQLQMLAAADDESAALIAKAEQEQRSREESAAAAIQAEEKAQAEIQAILNAPSSESAESVTNKDPEMEPATSDTETNEVAQVPSTPVAPAVNPFLSGGSKSAGSVVSDPIDMSWIDPTAELVIYARPGELLASGFMKPLFSTPEAQEGFSKMAAETGFTPADIESVTFGMNNVTTRMMSIGMQVQAAGGQPDPNAISQQLLAGDSGVAVIRSRVDINTENLVSNSKAESITYGDGTYYRLPQEGTDSPVAAVYMVDPKTYLFGTETAITSAIDRGPGDAANGLFGFVGQDTDFALIFANPGLPFMSGQIPDNPQGMPFQRNLSNAIRGKVAGTALVLNSDDNLQISVVLNLTEPAAGQTASSALEEGIGQLRAMAQFLPQTGQIPQPLIPVFESAVGSLKASATGSVVRAEVTLPGSIVKIIQENPQIFQQMMPPIPGGPGGPAGPGGFGPGVPGAPPGPGFPGAPPAGGFPGAQPGAGVPGQIPPAPQP
ncbi:MAG: hypothetical protein JNL58_26255 [Planctomyces sp.]|nr:hypothetical protein [Planctomyces sp.]